MAEVERLFAERSLVVEKVKRLQEQLVDRDGTIQPSLARLKLYESELQCFYKKYQSVYGDLLSAFPAERYAELDEDYERFEDLHFDACVLVETLLLSCPTTDNRYQHIRKSPSSYFTAPRWRSRSPSPTTGQTVPIPDVMEEPNTSPPRKHSPEKQLFPAQANEVKVSSSAINPIQPVKPLCAEASAMNPVCGPALVRPEGDLSEVAKCKSAATPIVPPSDVPPLQKCLREENVPTQREEVPTQHEQPAHCEDFTHREEVPTRCEDEVTTVAYEDTSNPPCKQATNPIPVPINLVGIHPKPTPFQRATGCGALPKSFLMPPGFHPPPRLASMSTDVLPVPKNPAASSQSFQCATGSRPVLQRFPCVAGFRSNPNEFPCAIGLCLVAKRFPCRTRFRPASIPFGRVIPFGQSSRLARYHPTPQRFPCVAGSIPALKHSSNLTESSSVVEPFQRVAGFHPASKRSSRLTGSRRMPQQFPCVTGSFPALKFSSILTESNSVVEPSQPVTGFHPMSKHPSCVTEFCVISDQFPDVAGFPPVLKQPSSMMGYQPVSQGFPVASEFHLVAKKFQCLARIHPIREQPFCATGPRSVLNPFPPSVGSHPAPEKPPDVTGIPPPVPKPPDVTGIPPPVSKSFRLPIEMNPVLMFLLPTGIPPVLKLALPSIEIPASFKPVLMPAGIPPMVKPQMSEMCPAKHPCPVPTGIHPVSKWLRCSTTIPPIAMPFATPAGIHPVREPTPMPTGKRPVLCEAPNQRLTKKMMPPVNPTGGSNQPHSKSRPEKPTDEASMRRRASEAIPECVSRTHPHEDVHQVVSKLSICGVCLFPILAQSGFPWLVYQSHPKRFCS